MREQNVIVSSRNGQEVMVYVAIVMAVYVQEYWEAGVLMKGSAMAVIVASDGKLLGGISSKSN